MKLEDIVQDQTYSHRTQISLSESMYQRLMQEKGDKSLAEHIRKMIVKVWKWQKQQQQDKQQVLTKLAEPMSRPAPTVKDLLTREKELRKDREFLAKQ